jgi:hypothetical protein
MNNIYQAALSGENVEAPIQSFLFDEAGVPASIWDETATKRTLDELFTLTDRYKKSNSYFEMLKFITSFKQYSPFNAMLVHIQMPGAVFIAPPRRWLRDYERTIISGARPLIILQPMGPVMFVFDVSETEGKPLPPEIEKPFEVRSGEITFQLEMTIENLLRDGIKIQLVNYGSQQAACIRSTHPRTVKFDDAEVIIRYELELDANASRESRYASLVHELAHLYCGHLGTPCPNWWPDRRGMKHNVVEFEAESVAYLVCTRLGIDNPSEAYLSGYVNDNEKVPAISLECVMKAASLIESMGRKILKARKKEKKVTSLFDDYNN